MGFLTTQLKVHRSIGSDESCRVVSMREYQNVFLFRDIVKKVGKKFHGEVKREIGNSINSQECLVLMEIQGKKVDFSWAWHGIELSTSDSSAYGVLEEIADYIECIRFNSLWLWFMEKTGGGT